MEIEHIKKQEYEKEKTGKKNKKKEKKHGEDYKRFDLIQFR